MPYIPEEARIKFDPALEVLNTMETAGELNYVLTNVILAYMIDQGESYQTYNDILGAFEGAKLEVYRRCIAPYENRKLEENKDVYPN